MTNKRKNNRKLSKNSETSRKNFLSVKIFFLLTAILLLTGTFLLSKAAIHRVQKHQQEKQQTVIQENAVDTTVRYIKQKEGFRAIPYNCKAGVRTIGYGDTLYLKKNPHIKKITEQEAEKLLKEKVKIYIDLLSTYRVTVGNKTITYTQSLNAQQQASIISFIYNVGEYGFAKSDLRSKIDQKISLELRLTKDYTKNPKYKKVLEKDLEYLDKLIKKEFLRWSNVKSGNSYAKLEGLEKRRREEAKMFLVSK